MERLSLSGLSFSNAKLGSNPQFGRLVLNARADHQALSSAQSIAASAFSQAVLEEVSKTTAIAQLIDQADQAGIDVVCKAGSNPFKRPLPEDDGDKLYLTIGLYQKDSKIPAPQDGKISVGQVLPHSQFKTSANQLAQHLLKQLQPMLEKAVQKNAPQN